MNFGHVVFSRIQGVEFFAGGQSVNVVTGKFGSERNQSVGLTLSCLNGHIEDTCYISFL